MAATSRVGIASVQAVDLVCKVDGGLIFSTPPQMHIPAGGTAFLTVARSTATAGFRTNGSSAAATLSCVQGNPAAARLDEDVFFLSANIAAFSGLRSGYLQRQVQRASSSPRTAVVNGQRNVTLVSQASWASFSHVAAVTLNGVAAAIISTTADSMTIQTPRFDKVCVGERGGAGGCGYVPLRLSTGGDYENSVGAVDVECETCVFYARQCVGYAELESCAAAAAAAAAASVALESRAAGLSRQSLNCGYGEADDCRPCPQGGYCPGGYLLWTAQGWWIDDAGGAVGGPPKTPVRCLPPQLERCVGYDADDPLATTCGQGYSEWACSACADEFYPDASGACRPCPDEEGANYAGFAAFVGCALGAVGLLFAASLVTTRWLAIPNAVRHSREFAIWAQSILQVVLAAAAMRPPGLPLWLAESFEALSVVELSVGAFVDPACMKGGGAYLFAQLRFALVLLMTAVAAVLTMHSARMRGSPNKNGFMSSPAAVQRIGKVRWALFVGHTALYVLLESCSPVARCAPDARRRQRVRACATARVLAQVRLYYHQRTAVHQLPLRRLGGGR